MAHLDFDIVIIGVGIIGACISYLVNQEKPSSRVLLIDKSIPGHGASLYSAGLCTPIAQTIKLRELVSFSLSSYVQMESNFPNFPIFRIPCFWVVKKDNQRAFEDSVVGTLPHIASDTELADLYDSCPALNLDKGEVVYLLKEGAFFGYPAKVVEQLIKHLRVTTNTVFLEGTNVTDITTDSNLVFYTSDNLEIRAPKAVISTGPWLTEGFTTTVSKDLGIRCKKVASLHLACCPKPNAPVISFWDEDAFLLPFYERGYWLYSFYCNTWDCTPSSSNMTISKLDREIALTKLRFRSQILANFYAGGRAFCDAYTSDRFPLITQVPQLPGIVIAGAGSGSGFRLAPGIARKALDELSC
jgi:glycine/D-amino acid oxidase-like deaminating enzyme